MARAPFDLLKYIFIAVLALFPTMMGLILKEPVFDKDIGLVIGFVFLLLIGLFVVAKGFSHLMKQDTDLTADQLIMFVLAGLVNIIFGSTVFLFFFPQNPLLLTVFEVGKTLSIVIAVVALFIAAMSFGRKRG